MKQVRMRLPNQKKTVQAILSKAQVLTSEMRRRSIPTGPNIISLNEMTPDARVPKLQEGAREESKRCKKTPAGAGWSVDADWMGDKYSGISQIAGEVVIFNNERTVRVEIGFTIGYDGEVKDGMLLTVDVLAEGQFYSMKGLKTIAGDVEEQALKFVQGKLYEGKESYQPQEYPGSAVYSMMSNQTEQSANHPSNEAISTAISVLGVAERTIRKALGTFSNEKKSGLMPVEAESQTKVASA